jgi:hypothetical protein
VVVGVPVAAGVVIAPPTAANWYQWTAETFLRKSGPRVDTPYYMYTDTQNPHNRRARSIVGIARCMVEQGRIPAPI